MFANPRVDRLSALNMIDNLERLFTAFLKLIRVLLLGILILVGSCIGCARILHDMSLPRPCEREGQRLGLTDIYQYTEEENLAGAYCSGRRNGRLVQFRAGGRNGF